MAQTISMDEGGGLVLPDDLRRRLGLSGAAELEAEIDSEHGAIVLRPADHDDPDAWAYTSEHLAQVDRSRADAREGRTRSLSPADLEMLGD